MYRNILYNFVIFASIISFSLEQSETVSSTTSIPTNTPVALTTGETVSSTTSIPTNTPVALTTGETVSSTTSIPTNTPVALTTGETVSSTTSIPTNTPVALTTGETVSSTTSTATQVPITISTTQSTTIISPITSISTITQSTTESIGNTTQTTVFSSLSCIQCNTFNDPNCKWSQNSNSAVTCINRATSSDAQCYTQTINNILYRGCMDDRSLGMTQCTERNNCFKCSNADYCNNVAQFKCIQCNSGEKRECRTNPNSLEGTFCNNSVTESTAVCYAANLDGTYIRGCLVDAIQQIRLNCDLNNYCWTCDYPNCNIAWHVKALGLTGILAFFLLTQII